MRIIKKWKGKQKKSEDNKWMQIMNKDNKLVRVEPGILTGVKCVLSSNEQRKRLR